METVDKTTGEVKDQIAEHLRGMSGYNERGEELPDPRPMALPVGFTRPKTLQETMRDLLRNEEFRRALDDRGIDTFEDANDFGDEELDPVTGSPYENNDVVSREQEIRSGFVEEIPLEKKEKARQVIAKHRSETEKSKNRTRRQAEPKKEAENGEEEEEAKD